MAMLLQALNVSGQSGFLKAASAVAFWRPAGRNKALPLGHLSL